MESFDENLYYYDEEAVQKVIDFVEHGIVLWEGEFNNQPMKLMEWQKERIIKPLFGIKRKSDGLRRYRKVFIFVPRKNGKTGLVIALCFIMLLKDNEPGAEINCVANSREQMQDVFRGVEEIVKNNRKMSQQITVGKRAIIHHKSASVIRILPSERRALDGRKSHLALYEEAHENYDPEVWNKLDTSTGSRRQPVLLMISTAGVYDPDSLICREYSYAKRVLSGEIQDDQYLAVIYEAEKGDDIADPATWEKANPSIDVTIKREYLEANARKALADKTYETIFRRYHLNQFVNAVDTWIPLHVWDACDQPLDIVALEGQPCWAGLDMSSKTDLTALTLCFVIPYSGGRPAFALYPVAWIPTENVNRKERADQAPYGQWIRDYPDRVFATEGNEVDHEAVEGTIYNLKQRFKIKTCGFDLWNIGNVAEKLRRMGITPVEFGQGYKSMSEPTKALYGLTLDRRIIHGGFAPLRHHINNVTVMLDDAENIKPSKRRSNGRIDLVVSSIMALDGAMRAMTKPKSRILEHGISMLK